MTTDDDDLRRRVRGLFAQDPDDDPDAAPEPTTPPLTNHVPSEGSNPSPVDPDREQREFVRGLFARTTD